MKGVGALALAAALAAPVAVIIVGAAAPSDAADAADELRAEPDLRSLIVVRDDAVALEWYRNRADSGPTNIKSASKSVLSALAGIALDRGLIPGLETPVAELLPEHAGLLAEPPRSAITLRHLLSMTAGLESTSQDAYGAWVAGDNWLRGALSRPMVAEPGEKFIYSTGSSHAVAAILDHAAPGGLIRWARKVLFDPAGIGPVSWQRAPEGVPFGGNNMSMTARDLARFGRLWLDGSTAPDDDLLPDSWIETATRPAARGWPERYGAYGLGWWLPGGGPFLAVGFGGQFLWVDPEHHSVVVVTSTTTGKDAAWDRRVLELVRRLAAEQP